MLGQRLISTRFRPRLLAGLAAGLAPFGRLHQGVAADPPDIIVLLINDARGGDEIALPQTMARLRDGGMTFPNFFLTTPLCGPSRATIFTGLYAHNTGVHENTDGRNGGWLGFARHGNRGRTTGVILQDAGYRTVSIGAYINGEQPGKGKEPGWTVGLVAKGKKQQKKGHDGKGKHGGTKHNGEQSDRQKAAAAVAQLERAPLDQPLYMHVGFGAPHVPVKPIPPYRGQFAGTPVARDAAFNEADMSDKPRYMRSLGHLSGGDQAWLDGQNEKRLECLLELDDAIARIWDALQARGKLDNTYVFFLTDNGYLLGQHRFYGKHVPYDGAVRMPLYAFGPAFAPGAVDERLVGNVDVAPTLADLAGATPPEMDGVSLFSAHERDAILLEFLAANVNSMKWPGPRTEITRYSALRTATHLYVEYRGGERELFDYENDPYELDNLLATGNGHTPTVAAEAMAALMRDRLLAMRSCSGVSCRAGQRRTRPPREARDEHGRARIQARSRDW